MLMTFARLLPGCVNEVFFQPGSDLYFLFPARIPNLKEAQKMKSLPMAKSLALFSALVLSLVAMVFLVSEPAMAQATTGRLTGTVVDPNGGIVSGTTVTAKNSATGAEKQFTTGTDGSFV